MEPLPTPSDEPPAGGARPAWQPWAIAIAIVLAAGLAFVVARSVGHHGSPAAANTSNTAAGLNQGNGEGFGGRFAGGGTFGTIAAIDGSTLTVTNTSGTAVTVHTSASTNVTTGVDATLPDIANGDRVIAVGKTTGTSTAATTLTDMGANDTGGPGFRTGGAYPGGGYGNADRPGDGTTPRSFNGQRPGGFATGTVTKVSGDTITVSTFNGGTATITVSSSTKITKTQATTVSHLAKGQRIIVIGTTDSDGSITATAIRDGNGGFGAGIGGRFRGNGQFGPGGPNGSTGSNVTT